jgi:hypothetical protein
MNVTDLIVIYLACGSPFGVYQITRRRPGRSGINWVRVVSSFVLWPAYAAALLAGRFLPNTARGEAKRHSITEDIRFDIEQLVFPEASISSLFEFREIFYRYAGLSEAADVSSTVTASIEIFEISGHSNKGLASRCLTRRNGERLAFHRVSARNEFVDLLFRLTDAATNRDEVVGLALKLADNLQDRDLCFDLTALLSIPPTSNSARKSDLEKEVWKSRTPTISTTN